MLASCPSQVIERYDHFSMSRRDDRYVSADNGWRRRSGSKARWSAWASWLEARSARDRISPPQLGEPGHGLLPLCPAPGGYVHQR